MSNEVTQARQILLKKYDLLENKADILKAPELKSLFSLIPKTEPSERAALGQSINALQQELRQKIESESHKTQTKTPIDVTAPMDVNFEVPQLLSALNGSIHPIAQEIAYMSDILQRMGFRLYESREIDDQYHMFETLNFPKGHPARDDFDTFMTSETDKDGDSFIAPAHTSTMQNRIMKELKGNLENGEPIAATSIDRVFRNEDLDARHEHTFYQHEGIFVGKGVHAGMLVATLKNFLSAYFGKEIEARINPFYFPFTEPSFEFSLGCPFCDKAGCNVCSYSGWIELLGCGMIHPNVLRAAGIDPETYTGFAWGGGVERLIMMKHGIEDVRHFESGKLDFLEQF
jgi:phenylalanyl-tRNA synthetase alpha chain